MLGSLKSLLSYLTGRKTAASAKREAPNTVGVGSYWDSMSLKKGQSSSLWIQVLVPCTCPKYMLWLTSLLLVPKKGQERESGWRRAEAITKTGAVSSDRHHHCPSIQPAASLTPVSNSRTPRMVSLIQVPVAHCVLGCCEFYLTEKNWILLLRWVHAIQNWKSTRHKPLCNIITEIAQSPSS